jgi:hypothetical protein
MSERARKIGYVLAVVVATPIGLLAAAVCMWWFTTSGFHSFTVENKSSVTLQNVVLSAGDFSERCNNDLHVGDDWGFPKEPRLKRNFHVTFDAAGRHYDLSTLVYMLPFGDGSITFVVDQQMRLIARPFRII